MVDASGVSPDCKGLRSGSKAAEERGWDDDEGSVEGAGAGRGEVMLDERFNGRRTEDATLMSVTQMAMK